MRQFRNTVAYRGFLNGRSWKGRNPKGDAGRPGFLPPSHRRGNVVCTSSGKHHILLLLKRV